MILIFDLDDTLVYTHKKAYEKTLHTAHLFNKSFTFEQFKEAYGKMNFNSCVQHWFKDINPNKFREKYNSIRKNFPYEPIGNIQELMLAIHDNNTLGIITNSTSQGTNFKLNCLGFTSENRRTFDFIYHKDNMKDAKPCPSQIETLCKQGYDRQEMIYFGDTLRDYHFALNGGIDFYAVLTGMTTKQEFIQEGIEESHVLTNIHDIQNI